MNAATPQSSSGAKHAHATRNSHSDTGSISAMKNAVNRKNQMSQGSEWYKISKCRLSLADNLELRFGPVDFALVCCCVSSPFVLRVSIAWQCGIDLGSQSVLPRSRAFPLAAGRHRRRVARGNHVDVIQTARRLRARAVPPSLRSHTHTHSH